MTDYIREIKDRISVIDYAREILGYPVRREGDRHVSLSPGSTNKSSCVFFKDYFYDHKLNIGGDVINLSQHAKHNGNLTMAISELADLCGIKVDKLPDWREKTTQLCNFTEKCHKSLSKEHKEYLANRGFTEETMIRNKLGTNNGNILIPCFELSTNKNYVSYYTEKILGGETKYKHLSTIKSPSGEAVPWGYHTLDRDKPLIITEGVFDAMVCDQEGYRTLSPLGGGFSKTLFKKVASICKQSPEVILVFDKDEAGDGFLFKMAKSLFHQRIEFFVYEFEKSEDLNDFYVREKKLDKIFRDKVPAIEYLGENIKDKDAFKNFVRQASKFIESEDMSEIFDIVEKSGNFNASWLKEIKKKCMKCPTQFNVSENIMKEHEFLYNEKIGFLEYSTGCYRKREDAEIEGLVADELGHYMSGNLLGAVKRLLGARKVSVDDLNKGHQLNFLNGMLNLKTGKLEQHDPSQLSTIQINYPYDEDYPCNKWREFVNEITEGIEEKEKLLQEIGGYILYPDNSLQKAFILLGSGSNGKSVFLETLRKVFDEENTSGVEICNLGDDFQRILLMNSLLNVSTEMSSDTKGTEGILKSVVAGDRIQGCYKHKGHIKFVPRVKMLFAANEMLRTKDVTYGFLRRLSFIKFKLEYKIDKKEMTKPYHREANTDLMAELEEELPGIFNWCYVGYKRLQKQRYFTETEEHKYLIQELKNRENPHMMFFDELLREEYDTKSLWDEYFLWCDKLYYTRKSKADFYFMADVAMMKDYGKKGKTIYTKR